MEGSGPLEPVDFSPSSDLTVYDADNLLSVANKAEQLIEAINKIKLTVMRVTNQQDWVDENGKPYLMVSGAEKLRAIFGIDWDIPSTPVIEEDDDGHRTYKYTGTFTMARKPITAIGSRSSRDPFFSRAKGADIPPEKINMGNVDKAAFTNCIGNGVTRILGIRNLAWSDLQQVGFKKESSSAVDRSGAVVAPPFGKFPKKPLEEVDDEWLEKYKQQKMKEFNDPEKAKFKTHNKKFIEAVKAEQEKRRVAQEHASPSEKQGNLKEQLDKELDAQAAQESEGLFKDAPK